MSTYRDIVVSAVESSVRGSAPDTGSAKSFFDSYMSIFHLTGKFPTNPAEGWKAPYAGLPAHDKAMDEQVISSMNVVNNGVNFMSDVVSTFWEVMVIEKDDGNYYYRGVPHSIDHVSVRLREEGYNLYQAIGGKKSNGQARVKKHIEARDIMYMAAILSAPELLNTMKNVILQEVFN